METEGVHNWTRMCLEYAPFGAGMWTLGKMPLGPTLQGLAIAHKSLPEEE